LCRGIARHRGLELLRRVDSLDSEIRAFVSISSMQRRNLDEITLSQSSVTRLSDEIPINRDSGSKSSFDGGTVEDIRQNINGNLSETVQGICGIRTVGSSSNVVVRRLRLCNCLIVRSRSTALHDGASEQAVISATISKKVDTNASGASTLAPDGDLIGITSESSNVFLDPLHS